MKRSPLKRKTRLTSHSTLKRTPMQRKRSAKARAKDFPQSVKQVVWERSDGMCERCKRRPLMHYHHCKFRRHGGTGELINCLGLCLWCHLEDSDSAHKSRKTREWCVVRAKELAAYDTSEVMV